MNIMKRIVRSALGYAGYRLVRIDQLSHTAGAPEDAEVQAAIDAVRPFTMVSKSGLMSLWDQVRYCEARQLPGVFIECGVWKGGACALMALANLRHATSRRHIHLFDAFSEICQPDPAVDGERALREVEQWAGIPRGRITGALRSMPGFYNHKGGPGELEQVRRLLERDIGYPPEYLHYHVGWFQDTLPQVEAEIDDVALLRLDGDYYASTHICLEHLAQKVVPGGFTVFDDYGAYEGCRRAVDNFLSATAQGYLHRVDQNIYYLVMSESSRRRTG